MRRATPMENPDSAAPEELCRRALALPRAQRGALLDSACKGDAELRRLVESLLEEHERLNEISIKQLSLLWQSGR